MTTVIQKVNACYKKEHGDIKSNNLVPGTLWWTSNAIIHFPPPSGPVQQQDFERSIISRDATIRVNSILHIVFKNIVVLQYLNTMLKCGKVNFAIV